MHTGILNIVGPTKPFAVALCLLLILSCATRKWNAKMSSNASTESAPAQELALAFGPIDDVGSSFACAWRLANYGITSSPKPNGQNQYSDQAEETFNLAAMREFGLEKGFRRIVEITRSHKIVSERLAELDALVSKKLTENWGDFLKSRSNPGDPLDPWKFSVRQDFFSVGRRTLQEVLKELENGNGYSGYANVFGFFEPGQKPSFEDLIFQGLLINDFHDFGRGGIDFNTHKVFPHRIQQAIIILDYKQNPSLYDTGKLPADYYKATANKKILEKLKFDERFRNRFPELGKHLLWGALFDFRDKRVPAYPDSLSLLTLQHSPVLDFTAESCAEGPWWTTMKIVIRESSRYPDARKDEDTDIQTACKKLNAEIRANITCPGETCR